MIRYFLAAAALKAFSSCGPTKAIYRQLGNSIGSRKRQKGPLPGYYLDRINRILYLNKRYNIIQDGARLLEIGTGWFHWDSIACRLFFDIEAVLFDVWDNRQLDGLKHYMAELDSKLESLNADDAQKKHAHLLITKIKHLDSFDNLYRLLNFTYVLAPEGLLTNLGNSSFDCVISGGVLEHIHAERASQILAGMANILKPGGYSFHSINLRDHLREYDQTVSVKQYLRYSERTWKRWFNNEVQYINRIQHPDWLTLFRNAGLNLVDEELNVEDIAGLNVAEPYRKYTPSDLACCGLHLLHRKSPSLIICEDRKQ